jgi:hypothetical protein
MEIEDKIDSILEQNKEIQYNVEKPYIKDENIQLIEHNTSSDLIHAMEILHSNQNLESNTILTNQQVNALALMNMYGQLYDIEFFKQYVALFPKYRISGDDGRGRKELIQIAEAIQRDKQQKEDKFLDLLGRK